MTIRRTFEEIRDDIDAFDNNPDNFCWVGDEALTAQRDKLVDEFNDWHQAHNRGEC